MLIDRERESIESVEIDMKTITLKEFEALDDDDQINRPLVKEVGAVFVERHFDRSFNIEVGDIVTLYEIIKLKMDGYEMKPIVMRVV